MVGIDTVVLTLPHSVFRVLDPLRFTPSASKVLYAEPRDMGRGRYIAAVCNPTKQDTEAQGYLPYVTLYRALRAGGLITELRIQFSAPKLLNFNNFDEIEESDFGEICRRIQSGLRYYNIELLDGLRTIANAQASVIHYSKNFVLTNYMSPRSAINELAKADVNRWRDVSKTDYVNNGVGFKTHSKYHELAFYDKLAEHDKGKQKKPIFDRDLQMQLDLFDHRTVKKPFGVLRMEVRLGNTKKIKWALEKARLSTDDTTFRTIFSQDYSQKVLQWHLEDLYNHYPKIAETEAKDELELLSALYVQNPERHMSSILAAVGLYRLTKLNSVRGIKDTIGSNGSQALLRLAKRINQELRYKSEEAEVFGILRQQLDKFEPTRLDDFSD